MYGLCDICGLCDIQAIKIHYSFSIQKLDKQKQGGNLTFGDYEYVSNGEFLEILAFSDRTENRNFVLVFQSSRMTMDHYSYLITLQVF